VGHYRVPSRSPVAYKDQIFASAFMMTLDAQWAVEDSLSGAPPRVPDRKNVSNCKHNGPETSMYVSELCHSRPLATGRLVSVASPVHAARSIS
jgi:hypothetical protein